MIKVSNPQEDSTLDENEEEQKREEEAGQGEQEECVLCYGQRVNTTVT